VLQHYCHIYIAYIATLNEEVTLSFKLYFVFRIVGDYRTCPGKHYNIDTSGGQTGERALVQEEQMGPLLTPGKISLKR